LAIYICVLDEKIIADLNEWTIDHHLLETCAAEWPESSTTMLRPLPAALRASATIASSTLEPFGVADTRMNGPTGPGFLIDGNHPVVAMISITVAMNGALPLKMFQSQ
jgi:hypothetical protein